MLTVLALALAQTTFELQPLERMAEAFAGRAGVAFSIRGREGKEAFEGKIRILRPNRVAVQARGITFTTDGKEAWEVWTKERSWSKETVQMVLAQVRWMPGFGTFVSDGGQIVAAGEAKADTLDGEAVVSVPIQNPLPLARPGKATLMLDPKTWLPRAMLVPREGSAGTDRIEFRDIVLDPPLTANDFRFVPPKDWGRSAPLKAEPMDRPGEPVRDVYAKPGTWTTAGPSKVRIRSSFRREGTDWVLDIEAPKAHAYDWPRASMFVVVNGSLRPARLLRKTDRSATFGYPRKGMPTPPKTVRFYLPVWVGASPIYVLCDLAKGR